jgi:hypothetical protein
VAQMIDQNQENPKRAKQVGPSGLRLELLRRPDGFVLFKLTAEPEDA